MADEQEDKPPIEQLIELAGSYINRGKYRKAKKYLKKALKIDPLCGDAYDYLGAIHSGEGKSKLAMVCFDEAIKIDPNDAIAHGGLAYVYAKVGDLERALDFCEKTLELDTNNAAPTIADAYLEIGSTFGKREEHDKAIKYLKKAIKLYLEAPERDPDLAIAYYNLGLSYFRKEEDDKAIEFFEKALEYDNPAVVANANYALELAKTRKELLKQRKLLYDLVDGEPPFKDFDEFLKKTQNKDEREN